MIRVKYSLCCETVVRDADNNCLTVVNILEDIRAAGFPLGLGRLTSLFALERNADDPAEYQLSLRATLDARELSRAPVNLNFGPSLVTRSVATFMGFLIPNPGVLSFQLYQGEESIARYDIRCEAAAPVVGAR
jgi:hypothetical protein